MSSDQIPPPGITVDVPQDNTFHPQYLSMNGLREPFALERSGWTGEAHSIEDAM